jgi:trimeric autotransporter adhesin
MTLIGVVAALGLAFLASEAASASALAKPAVPFAPVAKWNASKGSVEISWRKDVGATSFKLTLGHLSCTTSTTHCTLTARMKALTTQVAVTLTAKNASGTSLPWKGAAVGKFIAGPGANLSTDTLTGADLAHLQLTRVSFADSGMAHADLDYSTISAANLSGAGLPYAAMEHVTATGAASLVGVNLTDANLSLSTFAGANFEAATLTGADLSDSTFSGANFEAATLTGANLTASTFSGANLPSIESGGIIGVPQSLPAEFLLVDGYLIGPQAHLEGADLTDANLTGADLTGADITGAQLAGATITGVISGSLSGAPASLSSGVDILKGYLLGPGVDLQGVSFGSVSLDLVNLTGANLQGSNFANSNLDDDMFNGANLDSSTLTRINFDGSNLDSASFRATNLSGSYLGGIDLASADLTSANLTNVSLTDATLTGATLANSTLTGVESGGITGVPTSLPSPWELIGGYLLGPTANLSNAALSGLTLTSLDLQNAELEGANLEGSNLEGTSFAGADMSYDSLQNSDLQGATFSASTNFEFSTMNGADLSDDVLSGVDLDTDLTGADVDGTVFTGAILGETVITNVDFSQATLSGVIVDSVLGTPAALPSGWYETGSNGYDVRALLGPGAIEQFRFDGVSLAGDDLQGVDLSQAYLAGVSSGDLTGTPAAVPANFEIVDGYLVGPGASDSGADFAGVSFAGDDLESTGFSDVDFEGSNLSGADLEGASLSNADLTTADLESATLTSADLTDATLSDADLTGATLNGSATVTGADFSGAMLTDLASSDVIGSPAFLPAGWAAVVSAGAPSSSMCLIGPTAQVSCDFAGLSLADVDLNQVTLTSETDLYGTTSGGITGTPAGLPSQISLVDGYLVGPFLSLANADLSGANLSNAYLLYTNFTSANLTNANLSNAGLSEVDLTDADLTGANLTDAGVSGTITGTEFADATFTGISSSDLQGTPASLPAGWSVVNGEFVFS